MTVTKGRARVDRRTKNLVKRLQPHEIAVIAHDGIDRLAAEGLVAARAKAVINALPSISRDYPNSGPRLILDAGITLIDNVGPAILDIVREGDELEIVGDRVYRNGVRIAEGTFLTPELVQQGMDKARACMDEVLARFVENTLTYARQEVGLIAGNLRMPVLQTSFRGRHALVVVRGHNYREDLLTIQSYIKEVHPVLIGVDGGADALLEFGFKPDIVIGDMDSVSDQALHQAREIVVHAYPDGRAPGLQRVQRLGLPAKVFPATGTSEDIAMLLAYEKGAGLIVAVGTHSNMLDFLEKGRKGMASTFLVRLKIGNALVDARGVSQLYRNPVRPRHIAQIVLAALLPVTVVVALSPPIRELLYLLYIQIRVLLGM
ncbi:MAG: putative cytokinetic ring protein SteA [Thermoanaerobacterales bacterium]|nr:putative cytokinetic ring protein SteA [Bacillota bacterium]MDI6906059.1 putative cytokinetic ring protein SteA [Thermoanaerobacterales bacterium]